MNKKNNKLSVFNPQFYPNPNESEISLSKNDIFRIFQDYSTVGLDDMKYYKYRTVYRLLKSIKSLRKYFKPDDSIIELFITSYTDLWQLYIIGFVTGGYTRILKDIQSSDFKHWHSVFNKTYWELYPQFSDFKLIIETHKTLKNFNKYMSKFEYFRKLSLILFDDQLCNKVND